MEAHERRLVGGRFEVLETLGRGGMGVVYRARDRERGVDVALKTLRGITPESVLRFKTEFRALRDVRHPNLVELGELFEADGTWFFTMELIRGVTFLQWVRGETTDTPETASYSLTTTGAAAPVDWDATSIDAPAAVVARNSAARQRRIERLPTPHCDLDRLRRALAGLARGLAALHAAGKVHRDVKPSNILVEPNGRVVLLDFGVVAELSDTITSSRERIRIGTVKYMAPEQARGELVGPPADWYAVGVLLYQSLAGQVPFGNLSHDELIVLKQHVDPPPTSELADGIPPELDLLTQSLLEREARQRPAEHEIFETIGIELEPAANVPLPAPDQLFVGRKRELGVLDESLAASRVKLATVIVEGESGVGKSALNARFLELARERDPRLVVLHGRCHERERVPFNALDGVIDDLTRFLLTQREARLERLVPTGVGALLTVFPALRAVQVLADAAALERPAANVRSRAFAALRELMVRLCRRRATVILIEDLQWADPDSCALLAELTRTDDEPPRLCLVGTKRTFAADAIVSRLGKIRLVPLAGLDSRDVEELVQRVGGGGGATASQIIAETRGHPLFVRELARQRTTMRLDDAIWSRAARLDTQTRQLLAAIAIAGSPVPRHVALTTAGIASTDAEARIAALTRESLVRVHGPLPTDAIEPFHDRIREAVLAHQPFDRQRELAHALALALEAAGAPPAQLLTRFEAAGDAERAAHYLVAAAEAARAAFAFGRAAELFRRALDAPDLPTERRAWLLAQLADSLANDGRTAEAAERFLEGATLEPADSDRQLDLLRKAAERFLMSGRLTQGLDTTRAVLERAHMTLPSSRTRTIAGLVWNQMRMRGTLRWKTPRPDRRSLRADICWSIGAGLGMIDSLLGAYFSGRAARLALAEGNALQICRGMAAATIGAGLLGRRERADRLMDCAERAAAEDGTPLAQWYVGLARTGLSFMLGNDFARAYQDSMALENEWYAAGHGPGWETGVAMHFSLASQQMLGNFTELGRRVAMLTHNAKRTGDLFQEVTLRVRFAARHLADDRPTVAREDVLDALGAWLPDSDELTNQRAWGLWSRTRIAIYSGILDPELETEWERMLRSLLARIPLMQTEYLHVYGTYLLARAYQAKRRGLPSEHAALCVQVEKVARRLQRLNFPAAPASYHLLCAGLAWARGGDEERVAMTRLALDQIVDRGLLVYAAFLKRRLGEALGGDEGTTLVSQADALAMRSGWVDPERGAELALPTGRFLRQS